MNCVLLKNTIADACSNSSTMMHFIQIVVHTYVGFLLLIVQFFHFIGAVLSIKSWEVLMSFMSPLLFITLMKETKKLNQVMAAVMLMGYSLCIIIINRLWWPLDNLQKS